MPRYRALTRIFDKTVLYEANEVFDSDMPENENVELMDPSTPLTRPRLPLRIAAQRAMEDAVGDDLPERVEPSRPIRALGPPAEPRPSAPPAPKRRKQPAASDLFS